MCHSLISQSSSQYLRQLLASTKQDISITMSECNCYDFERLDQIPSLFLLFFSTSFILAESPTMTQSSLADSVITHFLVRLPYL